jgi:hypothetical protein
MLWLHDGQGGRLRACLPAANALDCNLQPKPELVQQLVQVAGTRIAELASKLDVMSLWQQLQYNAERVLLAGQPGQAAAESQQQQQQQATQEREHQLQQQQQLLSETLAGNPPTRAPGWDTPEERRAMLRDKLKSECWEVVCRSMDDALLLQLLLFMTTA